MRRLTALLTTVFLLAACADPGTAPGGPDRDDRLERQAATALERWDAAVRAAGGPKAFVPIGELTRQAGDWEPGVGDNNKMALMSGLVDIAGTMPTAPAARATVTWADGRTEPVTVLPAADAASRMIIEGRSSGNRCAECRPLRLTAARLTEMPVQTTRGRATAPWWEYTVEGTSVRVQRLAVDQTKGVSVVPPSWDPHDSPGGLRIESAATTAGSLELTANFTGSPGPASEPCGADYTARTVESEYAVVVIIYARPHKGDEMCTAIGAARTAVARLAAPLGERAVLEVVEGMPVPVTIA